MNTLISIITPTYNRAYILKNTIESVLSQTYRNWEMIIVDDGSTDNTKNVVSSYNTDKIKYIKQKNKGPSSARNTAMKVVQGDWACYIDSDNELFPRYLETMMLKVQQHPQALYLLPKGKRTLELYENNRLIKVIDDSADFFDDITVKDIFMRSFHFDGNGFMHSKKIIDEGFTWDEKIRFMEEWDFAMNFAEKYPEQFMYVPHCLFHYHQRFGTDGLVSNATYKQWAEAFTYIYEKHKTDKMLHGQTWYPNRVDKYKKLQKDLENGKAPAPYLRYFV